jgi:hypothetical protein
LANSEGVSRVVNEAAHYFRLTADQGIANAQFNHTVCLQNGDGPSRDVNEAGHDFRLAPRAAEVQYHSEISLSPRGALFFETSWLGAWQQKPHWFVSFRPLTAVCRSDEEFPVMLWLLQNIVREQPIQTIHCNTSTASQSMSHSLTQSENCPNGRSRGVSTRPILIVVTVISPYVITILTEKIILLFQS